MLDFILSETRVYIENAHIIFGIALAGFSIEMLVRTYIDRCIDRECNSEIARVIDGYIQQIERTESLEDLIATINRIKFPIKGHHIITWFDIFETHLTYSYKCDRFNVEEYLNFPRKDFAHDKGEFLKLFRRVREELS